VDAAVDRVLRQAGAILVADYGRGLTAHLGLRARLAELPAGIPVVWDPHPRGQPPVPGIRLATPSQAEARSLAAALPAQADQPPPRDPLGQAAHDAAGLGRAWGAAVAVTLGRHGALLSTGDDVPFLAPPPEGPAAGLPDTCGAGDCFAATAAQVLRGGGLLTEAVTEAVRRACEFVGLGGASAVPGRTIPSGTGPSGTGSHNERLRPAEDAWGVAAHVKDHGGRVVATGGCFDLLHAGHVQLLRQARRLGDALIVCLNSDSSVRALKGPGRPLVGAADRARVLTALECVDAVLVFDEPTPSAVLGRLRPDLWVKGSDYTQAGLAEVAVVRGYGGEVMLLPYTGRHSTSQIMAAAAAVSSEWVPGPAAVLGSEVLGGGTQG
jgi:rfaE bifunctional protein nucleotidyltransferase chain/domain